MNYFKTLFLLLICGLHVTLSAQSNYLYGLMRTPGVGTNTSAGTIFLSKLDVNTGIFTQISPSSLAYAFNITGSALDPNTESYFFESFSDFISVDMTSGVTYAQNMMSNPIATSYFDNFRFNTGDSTIYGLARRSISNGIGQPATGELYLATIDPNSAEITQISPQSIGSSYTGISNAINPHEMVYYYSSASQIIGLDMYTGQVYSTHPITFPQGGMYFDNFTYNCGDTSIYGLIRVNNTPPLTVQFGKINPQTGVVTQISQSPLPYSMYSANGSSTIDPINGIYYFAATLPQGGYGVIGVSVTTGTVVSENPFPTPSGSSPIYFDMMRHPSDCYQAAPERLNPNNGSAGLSKVNKSNINVAPNPFNQQLNISSSSNINTLILRDAQGKIFTQLTPASMSVSIETAAFASGIYFLELHTENGIEMVKVVK